MSHDNQHLARSQEYLSGREFRHAAECAQEGLDGRPDDGRLWEVYGAAQWCLKHLTAAREAFERASALVPLTELSQVALADCYVQTGQPESARAVYGWLAEKPMKNRGLLPAVAAGLGRLEEFDLALQVCERIAVENPTHHQAHFGIAYYRARLGATPGETIKPLAMAMDLAPHVISYRVNLAIVFAQLDRVAEAYSLVESVPLGEIHCVCWLRQMRVIFEKFGDLARMQECMDHLAKASERA